MKKLMKILLVLGFASAIAGTTVVGAPPPIIVNLNEAGTGVITGLAPFGLPDPMPFPGLLVPDPSGANPTALCYAGLPAPPTPGDLLIYDDAAHTHLSDIIRFSAANICFYSLLEGVPDGIADVAVLPTPLANNFAMTESGTGVFYVPTAGQPGFVTAVGGPFVGYNIISEVPEPSTLALVGLAGGLLALSWRRKSRRV